MGRGLGKLQKEVMATIGELGQEFGRPPIRKEVAERLGIDGSSGSRAPALTRALQGLARRGYLKEAAPGYFIELKTLDGERVVWRREVSSE